MADLRFDASTGRWVAVAPGRTRRPGATTIASDERENCPFCAGHEDRTPPETLLLGDGPTGWDVRVVPNLYPALERQEVVVHGPEHVHSIAELSARRSTWSPRPGSAAPTTPVVSAFRSSTRGTRPAPPPTRTRSSPGCPRRRRPPSPSTDSGARPRARAGRPDRRLSGGEPRRLRVARLPGARRARRACEATSSAPALRSWPSSHGRLHTIRDGFVPINVWLHEGAHWHLEVFPRTKPARGARARRRGLHRPRRARDGGRRASRGLVGTPTRRLRDPRRPRRWRQCRGRRRRSSRPRRRRHLE